MLTKAEYFLTKKRLAKREEALFTGFNVDERNWKEFCSLSIETQKQIRQEWEVYYAAVKKTPVYQVLQNFSHQFSIGQNIADPVPVAEWRKKAREALTQSHVAKPSGFDPLYAEYKAQEHQMFVNETKSMRKIVDEYKEVYETSRGGGMM